MRNLEVGAELPELKKPAIKLKHLKAYAKASGDHNSIHQDEKAAKKMGLPGVIAHGMLTMGFMGEWALLLAHKPQNVLRLKCSFKAMTFLGDEITVSGRVLEVSQSEKGNVAKVAIETKKQDGTKTCTGQTEILLGD